jgi:CyaY protein
MSTSPSAQSHDGDYEARARAVMGAIESQIDRWLQQDVVDIDGARTGGLLEMSFPGGSKIIVNTQPPLKEIWLAARSGGFHYRHVDGHWRDTKTGEEFFEVLSRCASEQAGQPLRFESPEALSS